MTAAADIPTHDEMVASWTGGLVRDVEPFPGSERLRPDGRPVAELRRELRRIDGVRNAGTALFGLGAPVAVIVAAAAIGTWWAVLAAIPVVATLQLRMFVIHHEAAHRLLFSNRRANDIIGINLFGWPAFGTGMHTYRRGHQAHHRDEFGPNEPDFLLYSFYPVSRSSWARKLVRDLFFISGWRIVKPALVGLVRGPDRVPGLRLVAGQVIVFAAFALAGEPWLYLWLWLVPYFTWYQVINRLRAIAEHGGMTRSSDRRYTTHIVRPSLASRILITPLNVAYHLPHHVDSGIPFRNLPRLQQILVDDGYVPDAIVWPNYRSLWRAAAAG